MALSSSKPAQKPSGGKAWTAYFLVSVVAALGGIGVGGYMFRRTAVPPDGFSRSAAHPVSVVPSGSAEESAVLPSGVTLPQSQWEASGIEIANIVPGPFEESIRLTGKVSLNEDRIAHIYPMVEGSVDSVSVALGHVVRANDLLVVVHSREVGVAKLDLYQARLQHEMAVAKDTMQQEIATNTRELLETLRQEVPIAEIESRFRSRTMGDFRERLLLAYSSYIKSEADVQRLEGPAETGAISAKQLYAARSKRNADQATYQSRIEQIEYELRTSLLLSSQAVREAATHVAVAETSLRILGCEEEDIRSLDPNTQGEAISHYSIRAPFDGTVISKDVTLKEQVRPDSQILSIADLSTVWITADIYEHNVPLLSSLAGKAVRVHNEAWPDRVFDATIFYTGEIMDESTRTIAMRAVADNPEHLLKPGMFVNVEIQAASELGVLTLPAAAILEHQGHTFVFVHEGGDAFVRQDVKIGRRNSEKVIVREGLTPDQPVVVAGGFILKSKMLEDLMAEE